MDHYLRLMVHKMGHQPQKRPKMQLMGQILGHQPQWRVAEPEIAVL
jgi:hypothetical protein